MATDLKDVYGSLNAASGVMGEAMEYLMSDGSGKALMIWGRLEQMKSECEAASTFMLENQQRLQAAMAK